MLNKFDICFIAGGMLIGAGITALAFLKHEEGLMTFGEFMELSEGLRVEYRQMLSEKLRYKEETAEEEPEDESSANTIEIHSPSKEMINISNSLAEKTNRIIMAHFGYGAPDDFEDLDDAYAEAVDREAPSEKRSEPYVISKDEYENERFYDKTTLCFYDDGILEEYLSESIVDDIPRTIGTEFIDKFGEYEDDVVFVRNDSYQTDYEVLRQHRNYAEFPR